MTAADDRQQGEGASSSAATHRLGLQVCLGLALAAVIVLPAATSGERVVVEIGGQALHLRFLAYAAFSALLAIAATFLVLVRAVTPRIQLLLALSLLAWMGVTTAAAGQPAEEWLPTFVRWVGYIAALTIGLGSGAGLGRASERWLRNAALVAMAVPMLVAVGELVLGTAPLLNGAPRISGTLAGHPVGFSLFLTSTGIILLPEAVQADGRRRRWAYAGLITVILLGIVLSYTRLTLVIALAGGIGVVVALRPGRRVRTFALLSVLAFAFVLVAAPLFTARFTQYATPQSPAVVAPEPRGSPAPAASNPPSKLVLIDNSTLLRIRIHQLGAGYVLASPWVGHGVGSFDRLYEADTGVANVAAHDDFLMFAVETGLPGLLLLLALYGSLTRFVAVAFRSKVAPDRFAIAAGIAFLAVNVVAFIHNPMYFPEYEILLWTSIGVALGQLTLPGTAPGVGTDVRGPAADPVSKVEVPSAA